jgi:hypothetical protein
MAIGRDLSPVEEHLVESEGRDRPFPLGVVVDKSSSIADERVVHGVPITAEIAGDLVDAAGMPPDDIDDRAMLHHDWSGTGRTAWPIGSPLEEHDDATVVLVDPEEVHIGRPTRSSHKRVALVASTGALPSGGR